MYISLTISEASPFFHAPGSSSYNLNINNQKQENSRISFYSLQGIFLPFPLLKLRREVQLSFLHFFLTYAHAILSRTPNGPQKKEVETRVKHNVKWQGRRKEVALQKQKLDNPPTVRKMSKLSTKIKGNKNKEKTINLGINSNGIVFRDWMKRTPRTFMLRIH